MPAGVELQTIVLFLDLRRYGGPVGPPATINREPGQARKGASTAVDLCAGVWLMGPPPLFLFSTSLFFSNAYLSAILCTSVSMYIRLLFDGQGSEPT